jgi:hypothetical protein
MAGMVPLLLFLGFQVVTFVLEWLSRGNKGVFAQVGKVMHATLTLFLFDEEGNENPQDAWLP